MLLKSHTRRFGCLMLATCYWALQLGIVDTALGSFNVESNFPVDISGILTPVTPDAHPVSLVVYVDKNATGAATGLSWEDAFTTLQEGVDAAAKVDETISAEVWVAQGVYNEQRWLPIIGGHGQNLGSLSLYNQVAVYGGFQGIETQRQERDWLTYRTVIDGSIARGGIPSYHVIHCVGDVTLDGFTVTGGNANLEWTEEEAGGGMTVIDCAPTIANCIFLCNIAWYSGGAIALNRSDARIVNCHFYGNRCTAHGGAIHVLDSTPEIINSLFVGNDAPEGGAIACRGAAATKILNCSFVANQAVVGGAIFNPGQMQVINSILWANQATEMGNHVYYPSNTTVFSCCAIEGGINTSPGFYNPQATDGGANRSDNPLFVRMPSTGPDSLWGTPDDDYGNLRVQNHSPLIDQGNTRALPEDITEDIDQHARVTGATVDLGAYEWNNALDPGNSLIFNLSSFNSASPLVLGGDAAIVQGKLRLNEASLWTQGSAWYNSRVPVQAGFETRFDFRIDRDGADGFAFVIQNHSNSAQGSYSYNLGYDIANSLAVEFDTYHNWEFGEGNANHVSVQTRGTATNSSQQQYSLGSTESIPFLSNNQMHTAKVIYQPGQLKIFVDDMLHPVLIVPLILENTLNLTEDQAFVGFTASTGGLKERHDILAWSFAASTGL